MIINAWKVITLVLSVVLIISSIVPAITGLFVISNEQVSVELFVMSHCPYGTQAMKGIIPAIQALGSNVDFKLRFVYYAMHGKTELDEQLVMYCVQKEQPSKLLDYLSCFLEAGDGAGCLNALSINVNSCVAATDNEYNITNLYNDQNSWLSGYYPLFPIDAALNQQYGIQGSPGLVVNGAQVSSGRSPQAFLDSICASFTNPPSACNQGLSSATPSAGFGGGTSTGATGSCG